MGINYQVPAKISKYHLHTGFLMRMVCAIVCSMLLFISSCDTPEKVMKSTDIEYKKAKAISWYNKKEYYKCIPVLEELIGLLKGRQSVEELYYMYANANYKQGDYLISAYHFKHFYDEYPNNEKAEECLYMYAKSYEQLSPKPVLDQANTMKALEAFQLFINAYPQSKYMVQVNDGVKSLRRKLELKALNAADLYYKTSNFKAAATTYANVLKSYPDIAESEMITYMIIKSNFDFAKNSIPARKAERFDNVIKSYGDFKDKFHNSEYLDDANKLQIESHYLSPLGAYEWAESGPLYFREIYFNQFFDEANKHLPSITDAKQALEINAKIEKGYFLVVKGNYQLSEEKKKEQKVQPLEETVKTYYNFVDKFPKSRYSKEAEKIFNNASEQLKKLKNNG